VVGAVTTFKVADKPTDPDGDAVSLRWSTRLGSGGTIPATAFTENGLEATWRRPIEAGEPAGGIVTLVARDKWGDETSLRFCVEARGFRC
jgi:hypothetical protein